MPAMIHYIDPHRDGTALCQASGGAGARSKADLLTRKPAKVTCPECTRVLGEAAREAIEAHVSPAPPR